MNAEKSKTMKLVKQLKKLGKFPNGYAAIIAGKLNIKKEIVYSVANGRSARTDVVDALIEIAEKNDMGVTSERIQKLERLLDGGNEVHTIKRIEILKGKLLELKEMEAEFLEIRKTLNTEIDDLEAEERIRRAEELYDEIA